MIFNSVLSGTIDIQLWVFWEEKTLNHQLITLQKENQGLKAKLEKLNAELLELQKRKGVLPSGGETREIKNVLGMFQNSNSSVSDEKEG